MKLTGQKVIIRDWAPQDIEVFVSAHEGKQPWMEYDDPYYEKSGKEKV
jgi:hypothetical protein